MAKAKIAQKGPYAVELEEGKRYLWCACGLSKKQPFCDGSHRDGDIKPVKFIAEESKKAYLCGCKQNDGTPFCNGSHSKL